MISAAYPKLKLLRVGYLFVYLGINGITGIGMNLLSSAFFVGLTWLDLGILLLIFRSEYVGELWGQNVE